MILYTLPITEQELLPPCEITLVYMKEGVFSELEKIRTPCTKETVSSPGHNCHSDKNLESPAVLPRETLTAMANPGDIPESTCHDANPQPSTSKSAMSAPDLQLTEKLCTKIATPSIDDVPSTETVIPENVTEGSELESHIAETHKQTPAGD